MGKKSSINNVSTRLPLKAEIQLKYFESKSSTISTELQSFSDSVYTVIEENGIGFLVFR